MRLVISSGRVARPDRLRVQQAAYAPINHDSLLAYQTPTAGTPVEIESNKGSALAAGVGAMPIVREGIEALWRPLFGFASQLVGRSLTFVP
jgi:hypothetical protein